MSPILQQIIEVVIASVLVAGSLFALVGAWGLARLPDFYTRLHAPTKATTLGVGGVLIASMGANALGGHDSVHELLITLFLFITAPISALMMARAALAHAGSARPRPPRTLHLRVLVDASDSRVAVQLRETVMQALGDQQPILHSVIQPYPKFEHCYEFTLALDCADPQAVTALGNHAWHDADFDQHGSAVWNRQGDAVFLLHEVRWAELYWHS